MQKNRVWHAKFGISVCYLKQFITVIAFVVIIVGLQTVKADSNTLFLQNGCFESIHDTNNQPNAVLAGWKLNNPVQIPTDWIMNPAYPGQLAIGINNPHTGSRFIRLTAPEKGSTHLYQPSPGFQAGRWYRIDLWARGGSLNVLTYEYFSKGVVRSRVLLEQTAGNEWQKFTVFYQPAGNDYLHSALAISTADGGSIDVDDISVVSVILPQAPANEADLIFKNDAVQFNLSATAQLTQFINRNSGINYAELNAHKPILTAVRAGVHVPAYLLSRTGDNIIAQFIDSDIKIKLRIISEQRHFTLEVLSVEPADIEALYIEFPLQRLEMIGPAFNATYNKDFGVSLFGITPNTFCSPVAAGQFMISLRCGSLATHGIVGAKFSLVATPYTDFRTAIMEVERSSGLPGPRPDGHWLRDAKSVRKSYFFATDASEVNMDTLIKYAKLGGFGTIIFHKGNWLKTHGHYEINTNNFPHGLKGVKAAVAKIHAAGLEAGAHVYGPSISTNDSYITPKPDNRLATVSRPPLAAALDEKTTAILLAAESKLEKKTGSKAFPGSYLRIGDEIIHCNQTEQSRTDYSHCTRGALGTKSAAYPIGTKVEGLLALYDFLLVDPDSTLANELAQNFADVINRSNFDMIYVDASDGIINEYMDSWYYLNRMHLEIYHKLKKDVVYQTSNGTGTNLLWHMVTRSASADGHGNIKGYLDDRWSSILGMAANFTYPDIGWYYWLKEDVRPDQLEYVSAKALGVGGSISLETSQAALEYQSQSRQMMETTRKWELCRHDDPFSLSVKAKLREPQKDFKLFNDTHGKWLMYRAIYEAPKILDKLDGQQNTWIISNDDATEVDLGVEIVSVDQPIGQPTITINGQMTLFPVSMTKGQTLTSEGFAGGVTLWPGGMLSGKKINGRTIRLKLKPGKNTVIFSTITPDMFPGNIRILLYRLWPMEKEQ